MIHLDSQNYIHKIRLNPLTYEQLESIFQQYHIHLNNYANQLIASDYFNLPIDTTTYSVAVVSLLELGLNKGASLPYIFETALSKGYELCPLELAPFMRLQFLNQPEGSINQPLTKNQAPYGSITIASEFPSNNDDFPKGFYIRKIDGELWLRGYRTSLDFRWNPEDCFAFLTII